MIAHSLERLACFDRVVPKPETVISVPARTKDPAVPVESNLVVEPFMPPPQTRIVETTPAVDSAVPFESNSVVEPVKLPLQTRIVETTPAADPAVTEEPVEKQFGRDPTRAKSIRELRTISATVTSTRKVWPDRIAYTLDNGQTWTQTRTKLATIFVGDVITITKGRVGGYFLRSEGGAQVKVTRTDKQE